MIVTVTMNPAIDRTVDIDRLEIGGLNRIRKVTRDAGGKGINVSRNLQILGVGSVATGFAGGPAGEEILRELERQQIRADFVRIPENTRTNTKVVEECARVTEFNEPGPQVAGKHLEELLEKLDSYAGEDTLFVLSGSLPGGVPAQIYQSMIQRLHKKGAKVLLDADKEAFRLALSAGPDILKPNHVELAGYFGLDHVPEEEELLALGKRLMEQGSSRIAISRGAEGALFFEAERIIHAEGLAVQAHSTVGAGDAMVAGLAYGWEKKLSLEEAVSLCMAVSAGAVTTKGTKPPSPELVRELRKNVRWRRIF